jgi:hypothetical protein
MHRRALQFFFVAACIVGSLYVGLLTLAEPTLSTTENRVLAPFPNPPASPKQLSAFISLYEAWFSDAVHFRQPFMRIFNTYRAHLGISPQKTVLVGKGGWLFFTGEGSLEDYRNSALLTKAELDRWRRYLLYHDQYARQHGALYVFFVVPGKERIYSEFMPDNVTQLSPVTRFDQILAIMKDTPVVILDLRPVLLEAKKTVGVYHKTDTHWNLIGAYYAYTALVELLQQHFPDLHEEQYSPADFIYVRTRKFEAVGLDYDCGLAGALGGVPGYMNEKEPLFMDPATACATPAALPLHETWQQLDEATKNKIFRATHCTTGTHRVLMMRDSFTQHLSPYLSSTFDYIAYLWLSRPWDNFSWTYFIDAIQPDIILDESAERYLNLVPRPGTDYPDDFRSIPKSQP